MDRMMDEATVQRVFARDPIAGYLSSEPEVEEARKRWELERKKVRIWLGKLSDRDRLVLSSWLGLDGPMKSTEEIAEMLGVSRERARLLEKVSRARFLRLWARREGCVYGASRQACLRAASELMKRKVDEP